MQGGSTANAPAGTDARQYHIGLAPGELAPSILLVGDPTRAHRVAESYLENPGEPIVEREYVTYTGRYRGRPMSVMGTGMGAANTEIAVIELCQCFDDPTSIAMGSRMVSNMSSREIPSIWSCPPPRWV